MGKDLARRIKNNSKELFRLYEEGKRLGLSNNVLSFLLLSAIEEMAKYYVEVLLIKCNDPTLRRSIRSRLYNEHAVKYAVFLAIYYVIQGLRDAEEIRREVSGLVAKWVDIRDSYLINVSHVEPSTEDLVEIEKYFSSYEDMEREILGLSREESCDLLSLLTGVVFRRKLPRR